MFSAAAIRKLIFPEVLVESVLKFSYSMCYEFGVSRLLLCICSGGVMEVFLVYAVKNS
jgi:hypothetical protein